MRFSLTAVLAFAASVLAQQQDINFDDIQTPKMNENVTVGETVNITWLLRSKKDGTVSVDLLGGESTTTLQLIENIAKGIDNTVKTIPWKVKKSSAGQKFYGIRISLEAKPETQAYSQPFHVGGDSDSGSSSSASGGSTDTTVTKTGSSGVKTMTLSTASNSTTSQNSTMSAAPTGNNATAISTTPKPTQATTTASVAVKPTSSNAAIAVGGSAFAAVGGIVAALVAL